MKGQTVVRQFSIWLTLLVLLSGCTDAPGGGDEQPMVGTTTPESRAESAQRFCSS